MSNFKDVTKKIADKMMKDSGKAQVAPPSPDPAPVAPSPMAPDPATVAPSPVPESKPKPASMSVPDALFGAPDPAPVPEEPKQKLSTLTDTKDQAKEINFQALRAKTEALETQLHEALALKNKYFENGELKKEYRENTGETETLKRQLAEANEKLGKLSLEEDPAFKAKYNGRMSAVKNQIEKIAKEFGADREVVDKIAKMNWRDRHAYLIAQLPDAVHVIEPLCAQFDQIEEQRKTDLQNHETTRQQLDVEKGAHIEQAVREAKESYYSTCMRELEDEKHFLLNVVPGNETWNEGVQKVRTAMRQMLDLTDPKAQSKALMKAVTSDIYRDLFLAERNAKLELQKQLALAHGSRPDAGSGSAQTTGQLQLPVTEATAANAAKLMTNKFFKRNG